jgi:N-acetylneuraminic acid mutarotase
MKTKSKLSAYILRGSTTALLFSWVLVALCLATHVPEQGPKAIPPRNNASFGPNTHQSTASLPASATRNNRSLSFAERVAYQRAIEDVYWRHRIWPKQNPDPKPSLDAVMSQAQLETKVEDYLRNSQALEDYSQHPITSEQLQDEMDRMAQHTKQPEVLHEIFGALGNNPFVIAECLARSVMSERLLANFGHDKEPLDSALTRAERQMPKLMTGASANYTLPIIPDAPNGCVDNTWTATSTINAPDGRSGATAVWTGSEMIVWGGIEHSMVGLDTGGKYDPSTDSWTPTSTTNAPTGRFDHTAVWTGSEMIVWGGNHTSIIGMNTGGRYNPSINSWTPTSTSNAPSARYFHTAVWTGSEMIVWGGSGLSPFVNTGGRYNPSMDSWTTTSITNAPDGRDSHTALWTGGEMIVWGGNASGATNTGGRYNLSTDSWTATSTNNAPSARYYHTAVLTANEMIVWGGSNGSNYLNTGGRYDPSTDSWTPTNTTNAPSSRFSHTAVLTGSEMIVWGGTNTINDFNTGGRYDPSSDTWTSTNTINAPSGRLAHTAVWTGGEMIIWGGSDGSTYLNTGGRYCAQSGATPTPIPTVTPTPTPTPRPGPITITIQTNPAGLSYTVDGNTYNSAHVFSWPSGSSHTISTTSPRRGVATAFGMYGRGGATTAPDRTQLLQARALLTRQRSPLSTT